jgi:hypothetical protein
MARKAKTPRRFEPEEKDPSPQRAGVLKHIPQPVSARYQRHLEKRYGQKRLPVEGLE